MKPIRIPLLSTLVLLSQSAWATQNPTSSPQELNQQSNQAKQIPVGENTLFAEPATGFMVDTHGVIRNGIQEPYWSYGFSVENYEIRTYAVSNPPENPRPRAMAWSADGETLYGFRGTAEDSERTLLRIDPSTGVATSLPLLTGYPDTVTLQGMTIDENDTCFIVATDSMNHDTFSTLYTCNLQTGQLTLVGTQSDAPDIHDVAATCDGKLYAVDSAGEQIVTMNKNDGSIEVVGPMGINVEYSVFDIDFDKVNGIPYAYVLAPSGYHTTLASINARTGNLTYLADDFTYGHHVAAIQSSCDDRVDTFSLNAGFNGSWYNPATVGQGFLFDVLPDSGILFGAWFTFDDGVSSDSQIESVGSPDQRWFTATGELSDNNVVYMDLYSTSGGVFNDPSPATSEIVGNLTVTFDSCTEALVEYEFMDTTLSGSFSIQRIAGDNVALCESLISESR